MVASFDTIHDFGNGAYYSHRRNRHGAGSESRNSGYERPGKVAVPSSLSNIDFNLLIVLDAILQERSVSKAAQRVGRTQPAISHALRRLRAMFDDELLVRIGQRYELTAVAEALANPLHIALQQMAEVLTARPSFDPGSAVRQFRIMASDFSAAVLVRPAIRKLAALAPGIRLTIEPISEDPFSAVGNGQCDLIVAPFLERPGASGLCFEFVQRDKWCCVASADNTAIGDELTRETFETLPHVVDLFTPLPEQGSVGKVLAQYGTVRADIVRTNYVLLTPFLLDGTSALAVLPRSLADWISQLIPLRVLPLPFEFPEIVQEMCWSSRYNGDPAHTWLRALLKDSAVSDAGGS